MGGAEFTADNHCCELSPGRQGVLLEASVSLVMVNGLSWWLGKQSHNDKCKHGTHSARHLETLSRTSGLSLCPSARRSRGPRDADPPKGVQAWFRVTAETCIRSDYCSTGK